MALNCALTVYVVHADVQILPEDGQVAMALAGARVSFISCALQAIVGGKESRCTATQTDAHLGIAHATWNHHSILIDN